MTTNNHHLFCKIFSFTMLLISTPTLAADIDCKQPYTVKQGDSLSQIAATAYGSSSSGKYNAIYYANSEILTKGPSVVKAGQQLRIPCPTDEADQGESQAAEKTKNETGPKSRTKPAQTNTTTPPGPTQRKIELLTAADYAPFTEKSLPGGGLITELISAALEQNNTAHTINWIDDWSAHLTPLLSEKKYDAGFPWFDPGCPQSDSPRCGFLFSKPVFELLIVLFTRTEKPLKFETDNDIIGSILCRPAGYFTHDLDNNGRNWLKDKKITLEQPKAVKECFDMLMAGKVDAVAINDFTGREQIAKLKLVDKVIPLEKELSIEGMHALAHKTHPRATIFINRINQGLTALHASGKYDEILDRHLINHWKSIESAQ